MVRNQFSYWLTATPVDGAAHTLQDVEAALAASPLSPVMVFWHDDQEPKVNGELDEDLGGTVEEDTGMRDAVGAVAARFPDFDFLFEERDEDDHSNVYVTKWSNGTSLGTGFARTLEPGELDRPTADAVIAFLRGNGHADAADFLENNFKV